MRASFVVCAFVLLLATAWAQDVSPAELGFTGLPLNFSADYASIPVSGTIPSYVTGSLFRNGPGNFLDGNLTHWFAGLGIVHAFSFNDGEVSYRAQFIRSTMYNESIQQNPCKRALGGAQSEFSPNTLVTIRLEGGHYTTNTGNSDSNEFDPLTLNTIGAPFVHNDGYGEGFATDHAQIDPSGAVVHFWVNLSPPSYTMYTITPGSTTRVPLGAVPSNPKINISAYSHSFGLTEHYAIISETPCFFGDGFANFPWIPELGVTWRVVSRATGNQVATFTSDAFFMMHHVHAYEHPSNNSIIVDLITYPNSSVILDSLYMDTLKYDYEAAMEAMSTSRIWRFELPLSQPGSFVAPQQVAPFAIELPYSNPAFQFHPYRYVYGISPTEKAVKMGFFDAIRKIDVTTGESQYWAADDCYPGEPIFVPNPSGVAEDDGVLLSVVLDAKAQVSFLLILDAQSMTEVARATAPNHVPFGFHGLYV